MNVPKQALERTRVVYDRTVMPAVRTATALITFRFLVYKFLELDRNGRDYTSRLVVPREFGITMIHMGLVSRSMASFEYRQDLKEIRGEQCYSA